MAFLPTRNLRDHIGPTIDQALRQIAGAEEFWWDVAAIPVMTPTGGAMIQGVLYLTTKAPTPPDSLHTLLMINDLRSLVDMDVALEPLRHGIDNLRTERAKALAGNNGGGIELP